MYIILPFWFVPCNTKRQKVKTLMFQRLNLYSFMSFWCSLFFFFSSLGAKSIFSSVQKQSHISYNIQIIFFNTVFIKTETQRGMIISCLTLAFALRKQKQTRRQVLEKFRLRTQLMEEIQDVH